MARIRMSPTPEVGPEAPAIEEAVVDVVDPFAGLTPLARAHAVMKARRENGEIIVRLDPIQKAAKKPTSLRLAITGKCWDCIGGDSDPNPRMRIRECPVTRCTLHPVRPYQKGGTVDESSADAGEELEAQEEADE